MLDVIIRFMTFDVVSTHPLIYWAIAGVWVLLLVASFLSLNSLEIESAAKILWGLLILLLPLVGIFFYALRCLVKGDWTFLKPLVPQNRQQGKILPK
jgi:hypothetical protein